MAIARKKLNRIRRHLAYPSFQSLRTIYMYAASRFSLCRSSKLEAVLEKADWNKERAQIGMSNDRVNKEEKNGSIQMTAISQLFVGYCKVNWVAGCCSANI